MLQALRNTVLLPDDATDANPGMRSPSQLLQMTRVKAPESGQSGTSVPEDSLSGTEQVAQTKKEEGESKKETYTRVQRPICSHASHGASD